MKQRFAKLIDVKSIVTLVMTGAMVGLLFGNVTVDENLLMLFSTSYGAMMTYFFTKRKDTAE